jgi:hypothetical protein
MMEKKKLRRADFVFSVILLAFSLFILGNTFTMPMKDSWGGVMNVWYVSPALLPLIVSAALIILGVVLLLYSIRTGGARDFLANIRKRTLGISAANVRFLAVLLALASFVYLNIPRVDFFLCIVWFLLYCIVVFYFDEAQLLIRLSWFYLGGNLLLLLLFITAIDQPIRQAFPYGIDVLLLLLIIAFWLYTRLVVRADRRLVARLRTTIIVSVAVPLILVPIFKFGLLVPLPHEGGIIGIMSLLRYALR